MKAVDQVSISMSW